MTKILIMKSISFNRNYFILFILILICELYIGFYVHDTIIRPYIGDLLVVILIYAFLRIFIHNTYIKVAFFTFIFACLVETAQYYNVITFLGLHENKVARVLIGTSFSWIDILAYFGGFILIIIAEEVLKKSTIYR